MAYRVELPVFSGPLDLLLHLVRQQEVDIRAISIARILDGYLKHLEVLRELDLADIGDFLVMASTLMDWRISLNCSLKSTMGAAFFSSFGSSFGAARSHHLPMLTGLISFAPAFSCSISTRSVISTNIVRVNLPPTSGFDHH